MTSVVFRARIARIVVVLVVRGRGMYEADMLGGGRDPGRCACMVADVVCASARIVPEFSSY